MAYLLTLTSLSPFCYGQPQLQGTHSRRSTRTRLINPVTNRTGKRPMLRNYSGGGMISSKKSCDLSIYASTTKKCLERIVFCRSEQVLISGFWIGPDIEDGWGFVEASLCRIY